MQLRRCRFSRASRLSSPSVWCSALIIALCPLACSQKEDCKQEDSCEKTPPESDEDSDTDDSDSENGGTGGEPDVTELPPEECSPTTKDLEAPPADELAALWPEADPEHASQRDYFRVHVRTEGGTPIVGATLTTVSQTKYVTDDNGNIAFDEPGQTAMDVYFHVQHPGFERAADLFGYRGAALNVTEGGSGEIVLTQTSGVQGESQGDLPSRLLGSNIPDAEDCFAIRFVDEENGRGVPLVSLSALGEEYWSDSQGMVAYCNPDHLAQEISFEVKSHGYVLASELPEESSVLLSTVAGAHETVPMRRSLAAERLYRITGSGIYRDSVLLGLHTPTEFPVLNAKVIGSDTVDTTLFKGEVFWLWQDTHRVAYPLGNFRGTAGVSNLPQEGGLAASLGVDVTYFVGSDGFAKGISEDFEPGGPVWMAGLISVPDDAGEEKLFASYAKVNSDMSASQTGMMLWNEETEIFERVLSDFLERDETDPNFVRPDGYAFKFSGDGESEHVYYPSRVRIVASAAALADPSRYELFTAYEGDELQQREDGSLDYAFRSASLPTTSAALSAATVPTSQDLDGHIRSLESGDSVSLIQSHSAYNPYRQRFLRQAQETFAWGELYYAEADTPMGPWVYAQKVITHDAYTFYNPSPHPEFDEQGGRQIFFEGTYTTFLQTTAPTPRYDYNQIMYRLDVDDPRVILPVPVYDLGEDEPGELVTKQELRPGEGPLSAEFLAYDRFKPGTIALYWSEASCSEGRRLLSTQMPLPGATLYALSEPGTQKHVLPLYEYQRADGSYVYSIEEDLSEKGFTRSVSPIGYVYESPISAPLPVRDFLAPLLAVAGEDQCLSTDASRTAAVIVSATGSRSLLSALSRVSWRVQQGELCLGAEGMDATFNLPPGTHVIQLTIEDEEGHEAHDFLRVTVTPADSE